MHWQTVFMQRDQQFHNSCRWSCCRCSAVEAHSLQVSWHSLPMDHCTAHTHTCINTHTHTDTHALEAFCLDHPTLHGVFPTEPAVRRNMGKSESQMDIMEKSSKPGKRRWTVAEIGLSVLLLLVSCALAGLVVLYTSAVKGNGSVRLTAERSRYCRWQQWWQVSPCSRFVWLQTGQDPLYVWLYTDAQMSPVNLFRDF